jgi:hypothetical protein
MLLGRNEAVEGLVGLRRRMSANGDVMTDAGVRISEA